MAIAPDTNSVFAAVARREYILVGSAPASMLAKATATNTKFMSLELMGQQCLWVYNCLVTFLSRSSLLRPAITSRNLYEN